MPKKLKTYFPARKKRVRTATHETAATKATLARVRRDAPSVSAMNDGATASGLTIVTSATNESKATLYSGMMGLEAFHHKDTKSTKRFLHVLCAFVVKSLLLDLDRAIDI